MNQLYQFLYLIIIFTISRSQEIAVPSKDEVKIVENKETLVVCKAIGFHGSFSGGLLENILPGSIKDRDDKNDYNIKLYEYDDSKYVGLVNEDSPKSVDLCLVYLHKNMFINEKDSLLLMQSAFSTVLNGTEKKIIALVLDTSDEKLSEIKKKATHLLNEAWLLYDKNFLRGVGLAEKINIIVLEASDYDENLGSNSKLMLQNVITELEGQVRRIDEVLPSYHVNVTVPQTKAPRTFISSIAIDKYSIGLTASLQASEQAMDWIREAAKASLQRLQKAESQEEFASFVTNLNAEGAKKLKEIAHNNSVYVSDDSLKLALKDLKNDVYHIMTPFYERFVQVAKQKAAKKFNAFVTEELETTVHINEDLQHAKKEAISFFRNELIKVIPTDAPKNWDPNFEAWTFKLSLDDFIEKRIEQSRLLGVLPRGRRPIALWIHALALHPFGRDYRQSPLTATPGDKIIFDERLAKKQSEGKGEGSSYRVHPLIARSILSQAQEAGQKVNKRDLEFAREMLMFPLSVKNPNVPLMGGRKRRRGSKKSPVDIDDDDDILESHPERYIDWNKEPLNEIRENLDELLDEQNHSSDIRIQDKFWNLIPYFRTGYYRQPPIHYHKSSHGFTLPTATTTGGTNTVTTSSHS